VEVYVALIMLIRVVLHMFGAFSRPGGKLTLSELSFLSSSVWSSHGGLFQLLCFWARRGKRAGHHGTCSSVQPAAPPCACAIKMRHYL